ncbi:hypothetical protein BD410DRAFT_748785 [Rickenella mellea]|uniref:MATH domain-containing protein n=1 Tax=Rickenella mellea TaxID=50990 RepID=A0A4Y7Q4K3_9AGAM|nr:hypothetical protein BD410DRAFT_748785 [Rickenella mellea]
MDAIEYQESTTVTLDWTLRGLKQLFDSSKGEAKSKVTKSVKFGGGRWQILFYANSGTEGGGYVSLYLSCEPTAEEKENAINSKWVREGLYKFTFELRNTAKTVLFNQKEAFDHSFSYKTANWGWAQFARRDAVYYQPAAVRHQDAFLITCSIASSPSPPAVPPPIPRQPVPKDLLDAVGALLDDPAYSDVEFVLPKRGRQSERPRGTRSIFAARRLLRRADYFQSMFDSGFAESGNEGLRLSVASYTSAESGDGSLTEIASTPGSLPRHFEDSDAEDEETMTDQDETEDEDTFSPTFLTAPHTSTSLTIRNSRSPSRAGTRAASPTTSVDDYDHVASADRNDTTDETLSERNVRAKLSHPSSPRQSEKRLLTDEPEDQVVAPKRPRNRDPSVGPQKIRVVVGDVAYATYRAVLYYLYTDTILFAPLSSSFLSSPSSQMSSTSTNNSQLKIQGEGQNVLAGTSRSVTQTEQALIVPTSRRQWIKEWEMNNSGKIPPCSAKAVYRLADKLDLGELKARAFQHIIKSLSVHNVPYEMFSTFSAIFEDVRKVQINYFLDNWNDIRNSDAMRNVWQQIRLGRHPGFEEVWPLIASNLEFKPRIEDAVGGDGKEGPGGES